MQNTDPDPERDNHGAQSAELMVWHCPNCGQSYFGKHPPDLCDYCQDFTTWRRVER